MRLPPPVPVVVTEAEERANSVTHGIGLVLSVVGAGFLLFWAWATGDPRRLTGAAVFGGALVFVYLASTLYHSFRKPHLKRLWEILDHIAIYLFIAGTYTPFVLAYLPEGRGMRLLAIVWSVAVAGAIYKVFLLGRFRTFSTVLYVAMGWLIVLELDVFLTSTPPECLGWIDSGGVAYMLGVVFFVWERLPYNHAIWHLFVLAGSVCHYTAVVLYALPG